MQVLREIEDLRDGFGFIQPQGEKTLNGHVYTAIAHIVYKHQNINDEQANEKTAQVLQNCFETKDQVTVCKRDPQGNGSVNSLDNYAALGFLVHELGERAPGLRKLMLDFLYQNYKNETKKPHLREQPKLNKKIWKFLSLGGLLKLRGCYNDKNPNDFHYSVWIRGFYKGMLAHWKWALGIEPSLIEKVFWAVGLILNGLKSRKHKEAGYLAWMNAEVAANKSKLANMTIKVWKNLFQWNTLGQCLVEYFRNGSNNPLAKHSQFSVDKINVNK